MYFADWTHGLDLLVGIGILIVLQSGSLTSQWLGELCKYI